MPISVNLREITDRVLGLSPPRVLIPARLPRRTHQGVGLILLLLSALAMAASLGLWIGGHGGLALRIFGGTVLLLALSLRLL